MARANRPGRGTSHRRPLVAFAAAALALLLALHAAGTAFTALRARPLGRASSLLGGARLAKRRSCRHGCAELRSRVALRVTLTTKEGEVEEETSKKPAASQPQNKAKGGKLPSQFTGLSQEEIEARKAKALDIWDSLKVDVRDEIGRYQTFRPDKFEKFMRADSRGVALFEIYKPGTPEYAEFFEEVMGPFIFELAQEKLKEGLSQAAGVILVVGTIAAILGYFGTDIIQGITAPFTGFAEQFVELYGF
uniref:Uncharacterized protein n=1 Tax=Pyrodinium bahamense TaxID=73915 RepID=A0A7S0A4P8_9DINO